ncbi:hypothetical protein [Modestobacter italicus]|nr:hypothetical protein [Modestobacter italicus]
MTPARPGRAMLWGQDGGQGIWVELSLPLPEQVAQVADGIQDWAFEEL